MIFVVLDLALGLFSGLIFLMGWPPLKSLSVVEGDQEILLGEGGLGC